jgi:hypothetical protein
MLIGVNLPNYSSLGHRDAMIAIAQAAVAKINGFGRKAQFEVSLRVVTRIGPPIPDGDPETTLQGDADAILRKIQRYSEAGVDRIMIEPASTNLDDFLRQLARFADEITPHITRTSV